MILRLSGRITDDEDFKLGPKYYLLINNGRPRIFKLKDDEYVLLPQPKRFIFIDESINTQATYDKGELILSKIHEPCEEYSEKWIDIDSECLKDCPCGSTGSTSCNSAGPTGPAGATGPTGPAGATGPAGSGGSGYVIPYASGPQVELRHLSNTEHTGAIIAFGSNLSPVKYDINGNPIEQPTFSGSYTFSIPKDGTINDLSVSFQLSTDLELRDTQVSIFARLYESEITDNKYIIIPPLNVDLLPVLTGNPTPLSTVSRIFTGINHAVSAGNKIMLLIGCRIVDGPDISVLINGVVSAGLSIS